jgi:hypothetical protein
MGGREKLPYFRLAAWIYGVGIVVFAAYGTVSAVIASPEGAAEGAPSPVWKLPVSVTVAALTVIIGGHLLAASAAVGDWAAHPGRRHEKAARRAAEPRLTQAELATAEAYDDTWQAEEQAREHR